MTLHKIREELVDKKQLMTAPQLAILVTKLGLAVIGLCLDLCFASYIFLGFPVTVAVIFVSMLGFNWIFDMLAEDDKTLKGVRIFANCFFIFYVMLLAEFLVLKYFRFL